MLEYVLYKVLNMDYYDFDMPQACEDALDEYKAFKLLYDLYQQWFKENNPSGTAQNKTSFIKDIIVVTKESKDWNTKGKSQQMRIGNRMSVCEPLLDIYDLKSRKKQRSNAPVGAERRCP